MTTRKTILNNQPEKDYPLLVYTLDNNLNLFIQQIEEDKFNVQFDTAEKTHTENLKKPLLDWILTRCQVETLYEFLKGIQGIFTKIPKLETRFNPVSLKLKDKTTNILLWCTKDSKGNMIICTDQLAESIKIQKAFLQEQLPNLHRYNKPYAIKITSQYEATFVLANLCTNCPHNKHCHHAANSICETTRHQILKDYFS